jgi:hypothetical protein
MTVNPVTTQPLTRLKDALELMSRRGLRHLPVVGADREYVGLVSEHDIRTAWNGNGDEALERGVLSVTKLSAPTLDSAKSIEDAWAMLSRSPGLNPLPVVTDGKLEGTVSQHDLLRAMAGLPPQAEPRDDEEPLTFGKSQIWRAPRISRRTPPAVKSAEPPPVVGDANQSVPPRGTGPKAPE